jgi:anti-anti-sigma factor
MTLLTRTTIDGPVAHVALTGEADSDAAPALTRALDAVTRARPRRVVLDLTALTYLSSAGLRCLVHAHQLLGRGVEMVLSGASEDVADTIRLTGLDASVTMVAAGDGDAR